MTPSIKLSWRRQPSEKGLASVGQGERGWELWLGKTQRIAYVNPRYREWSREKIGYYWVARSDLPELAIPVENTANVPSQMLGQAIKDAEDYVKKYVHTAKIDRAALTKAGIQIPD